MFNGFKHFCEGFSYGYFGGDMKAFLGGGRWEHLNYGGSKQYGLDQPMLYVPINVAASTSGETKSPVGRLLSKLRRKYSRHRVLCNRDESIFTKYSCQLTGDKYNPEGKTIHIAKFMPTGESHVTIAIYPQLVKEVFSKHFDRKTTLTEEIDFLKSVKIGNESLFKDGNLGIEMPVTIPEPAEVIFGVSSFMEGNPIVALVVAQCERLMEVKQTLGLSSYPGYKVHLTIGYAKATWDLPEPDKKIADPANIKASARSGPGHLLKQVHNASYLKQQQSDLPEGFHEIGRILI